MREYITSANRHLLTRLGMECVLGGMWLIGMAGLGSATAAEPWKWSEVERTDIAAREKRVRAHAEFFELETPVWRVKTAVSARFTAELAVFMDLLADTTDQLLPGKMPRTFKPTVTVFACEDDYRKRFTADYLAGSRGCIQYKTDSMGNWIELGCWTFLAHPSERDFAAFYHPILQHEGTHVLVRGRIGPNPIPTWLDEGLANFFQFWDLRANVAANREKRMSRSPHAALAKTALTGRPHKLPTVSELMSLPQAKWNPDQMGPIAKMHYGAAESLVETLLSDPEGTKLMGAIWEAVRESRPLPKFDEDRLRQLWHRRIRDYAP